MSFEFEQRNSESPLVERIWRTRSERPDDFMSVAAIQWEMVFTRYLGKTSITLRGPETIATQASMPPDAEFFGIIFKLGTYMPHLPVSNLVDGGVNLPEAASQSSFWLHGSAWHVPTYENADSFIEVLTRRGMLTKEHVVEDALNNRIPDLSIRSVQRRFISATGITHGTVVQIERARLAATLLEKGVSILDTVELAGYSDQPHLTRSMKRFFGKTPTQIPGMNRSP